MSRFTGILTIRNEILTLNIDYEYRVKCISGKVEKEKYRSFAGRFVSVTGKPTYKDSTTTPTEIVVHEIKLAKKSKYNNVKCEGYDSKKECTRAKQLQQFEKVGKIKDLTEQPKFVLQESFKDSDGKTERAIVYKADFQYFDNDLEKWIVEDVKGFKTDVYAIKKKLFKNKHPEFVFKET